ncbi:MAG: methyltransferase [Acidobacteriia bacterium]|nr:methyltransferase [Terriglobia bacterium]MYC64986.1 methyltransferase [Terriglobia bacterium]
MRVIGGRFRGRRLLSMEGTQTRPMLGRMRQRLFDILQGRVEGRVFADLYAGTGSVGIEALSRGARAAVFVESSARAAGLIRRNLEAVGALDQAQLRQAPVGEVIDQFDADIYFLGPPYEAVNEYASTLAALARQPAQWVIAQHAKQLELAERYGSLRKVRVVKVGANRLSMFRHELPESDLAE